MIVDDVSAIPDRYARRINSDLYSILRPEVRFARNECFAGMIELIGRHASAAPDKLSLVDLGCGSGGYLLDFLRMGFLPERLTGLELLEDRAEVARGLMPKSVSIISGDASIAPIAPSSIDIAFQSVVFSSLLNDSFQSQMANAMWTWIRPGGGVLWYDFIYDNPWNEDVRGVPLTRIRELFPEGRIFFKRVTLAPPIARRVGRLGPLVHGAFHALPILRTHLLAWISK